ncbi:hypothetical protein SAMN06297387_104293 [Streptomyces zhaozhouensis]|uniref:Transposase n=1 Tax=Streptomyces zhaozhouensis TaxID=1300267 RepID=A0A286DU50_9ACTN|nr:DUF6262 family protein [Streptomyces zhaozhouensis]SOD62123.1 hypothetical protein SAMN06297387_104293 [Streptomyces zhaozhouensis]
MSEQLPRPRTAAAIAARRQRTQAKVDQVRNAIVDLQHRKAPVTAAAVVRRAGVSRTFLYENADARKLISDASNHGGAVTPERAERRQDAQAEAAWRERALNTEDALKAAHGEIRAQRNRIAQLMGQIRDLETQWTDESMERVTTENTNLKQRVRQLAQDKRTLEERLQAARSNSRFQDRRISQLEAQLLELGVPVRMLSPAANGGDLGRASPVWVTPGPYGCGE